MKLLANHNLEFKYINLTVLKHLYACKKPKNKRIQLLRMFKSTNIKRHLLYAL